ncbi:MAG: hypothetical protein DWQ05_22815 [Calditrichaeota bacterium]|nr:MAG: hypothetical protein DWQ05_22815 [Calditrichota bacterium]
MKSLQTIVIILLSISFFFACENDKNPTKNNETGYETVQTTNIKEGAVYFNFAEEMPVPVYDLQFGTYNRSPEFMVNPAVLGQGGVEIYMVENAELAAVDTVDEASFSVDADTSVAGDSWYNYDFQTHTLSAKQNVYVLKTATGMINKFQVKNYNADGSYEIAHAVWDAAAKSFSAEATVTVPGASTEEVYFSFAHGAISPADWDIKLCILTTFVPEAGFSMSFPAVLLNSESGVAGAIVAEQEFADIDKDAVTGLQADTPDAALIGSDWFDYDSNTHRVVSKGQVYVIQTMANERVKFHITNYYNEDGVSGFMTLEYEK